MKIFLLEEDKAGKLARIYEPVLRQIVDLAGELDKAKVWVKNYVEPMGYVRGALSFLRSLSGLARVCVIGMECRWHKLKTF